MRQQDSTKRVRSAITSVMDDYGVQYQDVRRRNHAGIMFTVRGQTRTITYGGGDPRAHKNARSQTRRLLDELGLVKNNHQRPEHVVPANTEGSMPVEASPSIALPVMEMTETSDASSHSSAPPAADSQPAETAPATDESSPPRHSGAGYVVFTPTKYDRLLELSRGRFFAVKLDRDLIADKGTMLVLPFDLPDVVLDMPEHEFKAYFQPVTAESVAVETPAVETPKQQQAEPVTEPLIEDLVPFAVELDDDYRPAQFPKPVLSTSDSKRTVSPQMGRVLLAMLYLHNQGENEFSSQTIQALLSPVDAKQVAGMLSGAIKHQYVVRGSPLKVGRGTRFKLSLAGRKLAASLKTWPYDHRGLAIPPWLYQMTRAAAS